MIWAVVILAAGIVLAVLSVLLRKKLGRGWMASLLAAGILLTACGGWLTHGQLDQRQQTRENVYLGLQYLELRQTEPASFYLKKAGTADDFVTAAARYLLELVRGNELNARLNLDSAQSMAGSSDEESLLSVLEAVDVQNEEQFSRAVQRLADLLGLSQKREEALALFVQAESGGGLWDSEEISQAGLDETTVERLQISSLLSQGSYESAVSAAVSLVDRDPSADNRLLLAETVGESAYNGVPLNAWDFAPAEGDGEEDTSADEERQALDEERMKLEDELAALELSITGASDQELQQLNQEKLAVTEEIQQLQQRADKLFVYRAFNAIADLHSLEAQLVRARLYFALQDHEKAVETLLDSAGSLQAKLTADQTLANNLRIVEQAYASQTELEGGQEFQDAMTQLLSAPFADLMYISQNQLTQDFVQRIVSDQKTYGQGLFVSNVDVSAFPQVKVTLSGREETLLQILEQQETTARDTRQDVTYTAELQEGLVANVCVVVDRSGSMDGAPIENLKSALEEFVHNARVTTPIALVAFDSGAEELMELTTDQAALLNTVSSLQSGGGTEITSGIQAGMDALEEAAGSRVMLLMTDGQSSVDFSVVEEAAAMGITIHTIGFGSVNDSLLEQIAQQTGGQYVRADSSSELSNIYASLQAIIGNVITVEYTAPNPEDTQDRYFFLRVGETSVRKEYFLTKEAEQTVQLYSSSPSIVTPEQLTQLTERGGTLSLSLRGEDLLKVTGVTVGGQAAQIERQEAESLQVSVPPALGQGWQTVELTLEDGTALTFDRLLLVGEYDYYRNIRLGSLLIPSAQGVLPGDGTLVLAGTGIELEENLSPDGSSLSLSVSGTLILPWTPAPAQPGEENTSATQDVNLGDQGTITGWGQVTLRSGDSAYDRQAPSVVAQGALRIECAADQSKLIQTQEGEG